MWWRLHSHIWSADSVAWILEEGNRLGPFISIKYAEDVDIEPRHHKLLIYIKPTEFLWQPTPFKLLPNRMSISIEWNYFHATEVLSCMKASYETLSSKVRTIKSKQRPIRIKINSECCAPNDKTEGRQFFRGQFRIPFSFSLLPNWDETDGIAIDVRRNLIERQKKNIKRNELNEEKINEITMGANRMWHVWTTPLAVPNQMQQFLGAKREMLAKVFKWFELLDIEIDISQRITLLYYTKKEPK